MENTSNLGKGMCLQINIACRKHHLTKNKEELRFNTTNIQLIDWSNSALNWSIIKNLFCGDLLYLISHIFKIDINYINAF